MGQSLHQRALQPTSPIARRLNPPESPEDTADAAAFRSDARVFTPVALLLRLVFLRDSDIYIYIYIYIERESRCVCVVVGECGGEREEAQRERRESQREERS